MKEINSDICMCIYLYVQETLKATMCEKVLNRLVIEVMEHATNEYRQYKQRMISGVEHDYLDTIKRL